MKGAWTAILSISSTDGLRVGWVDGRTAIEGRAEGFLPQDLFQRLRAMIQPNQSHLSIERNERDLAGRLVGLFDGPGMAEIRTRMWMAKTQADHARIPLRILLDLRSEMLRLLPWELMEAADNKLLPKGIQWLRVGNAAGLNSSGPMLRRTQLEVIIHVADPNDKLLEGVAACLRAALQGMRGAKELRLGTGPLPPALPGSFRVLHILCSSGITQALQLVNALVPLRSMGLVVLDVCGLETQEIEEKAGWRLILEGSQACVAPQLPMPPDASMAFSRSLYQGLLQGLDLPGMMEDSRRTLRALASAHVAGRWWGPTLLVAESAVLSAPPLRRLPLPGLWPSASPEMEEILDQASDLANNYGFLGVEHLAAALVRVPKPGPVLGMAQPALQIVAAMLVPTEGDGSMQISPRLGVLSQSLPEGFGLEALLRAIALIPWVGAILGTATVNHLRGLISHRNPRVETDYLDEKTEQQLQRGLALEVLGGPDDGRILSLSNPEQILGRWDPTLRVGPPTLLPGEHLVLANHGREADLASRLFIGGHVVERTVSRRHLQFLPPRSIRVFGPTQLQRGDFSQPISGDVELMKGDRLLLGVGTRLLVL